MIDIVNKEIFDEKDVSHFAEWCVKIEQDCDSIRKDGEHSQLSLLWILLHEFRHKIQTATLSISTNLDNGNFRHFMDYLKRKDNTENNINHVFHEIIPYEIDANIFACELLDIKYPGSKFEINDYTMGFLK